MYSDLFDVIGNQQGRSSGGNNSNPDKHVALSFKAGKCEMTLQENGKYWITPDTRRGSVQLVWSQNSLKWEWVDRRNAQEVVDSFEVDENVGGTWQRVSTSKGLEDASERVYVWSSNSTTHRMYWMQDESADNEDELVAKVNQYLTSPKDAAPEGEAGESSSNDQNDALSNILNNLASGETAGATAVASSGGGVSGAAKTGTKTGTLTLADLQGAMAGLQTSSTEPPDSVMVQPLTDTMYQATEDLMKDPAVRARLLELLPEEQRSEEYLRENLTSPQLRATYRALFHAVLPDETGSMEGYHSLIANFQLDPKDGEEALRQGNPIKAFLECIIKSVEKEKEKKEDAKEESKEESEGDDSVPMEE